MLTSGKYLEFIRKIDVTQCVKRLKKENIKCDGILKCFGEECKCMKDKKKTEAKRKMKNFDWAVWRGALRERSSAI